MKNGECSHGYKTEKKTTKTGMVQEFAPQCPLCNGAPAGLPYSPGAVMSSL